MTSTDTLKASIVGFLMPVYETDNPNLPGERLYGLAPGDFQKVRDGYACARCLAEYRTYTASCLLCGWQRDIAADIGNAPDFWQQSVDERENDRTPYAKVSANPFDDAMRRVQADSDVENVALSALAKKTKVRRG